MDKAFLLLKDILRADTLITYLNHNKPFHIYTDESDYQIGAVIIKENKMVAY